MGWIGVDLDRTLAVYPFEGINWNSNSNGVGPPVPKMANRVKRWLAEGKEVRIVTARVGHYDDLELCADQTRIIGDWCEKHLGKRLAVQAHKDFEMEVLYDDRAITVEQNTGEILTH